MTLPLTYKLVIHEIDQNFDLATLSSEELFQREEVIKEHIQTLTDDEALAIACIYQLIFGLKTRRLRDLDVIEDMYEKIKGHLLAEEYEFQSKIKQSQGKPKNLVINQLLYFYKLVTYYLMYLEKTLTLFGAEDLGGKVNVDKVHFLQRQQFLEGNLGKFLSYTRLTFTLFFRKYVFLYALLSGIGIVLFWHGLWGIYDWVIAELNVSHTLLPYVITSFFGLGILYVLGAFFNQTIGDRSALQDIQEMESAEIAELKDLEKIVQKKMVNKSTAGKNK